MSNEDIKIILTDSDKVTIGLLESCLDPRCLIVVRIINQDEFLRFLGVSHLPISRFSFAILVKNFDWSVLIGRQIYSYRELARPHPAISFNYLLYKGSYDELCADFSELLELPKKWDVG